MENTSINYSNVTNSTTCSYDYCVEDTLCRKVVGTIIFIVVWPFIVLDMKWFPISRPAAALVGATFMVAFLVVPEEQVFHIIGDKANLQTIFLLVGMMLLSYYYDREGLLRIVALWIFGNNKTFKHVLWKICILSAILSAIITNDATCLVITPLLVNEHMKQRRPQNELLPMLLGIATSANIGSASTYFGNPQNAFIAASSQGQISLLIFFVTSLPAAILGILLSILLLYLICFRTVFPKRMRSDVENNDNHENGADFNPNEYNVEAAVAPTLSESREDLALSYDGSINPHLSSQIAYERRRMYNTAPGQDSNTSVPKNRSRYSLPANFRGDHLSSPQLSLVNHTASVSNPIFSTHHNYGATQDSSAHLSQRSHTTPHSMRSPHRHVRIREQHHSIQNSPQRVIPLPEIPEEETLQRELPLTNEDEGEVVDTVSFKKRKCQEILFVIWLIAITIVVLALLAVPQLKQVQFNLGLIPLAGGILTMLADTILNRKYPYDAITKIDWAVILMFMGLFVWLEGFQNTNFLNLIFEHTLPYMNLFRVEGVLLFTVVVVIGSNVLSNVPLVILVVNQLFNFHCGEGTCTGQLTGVLLAWVSTIAGNFTLIGSVANLIVAEKARSCANYRLTFWGYLKFGFVSTMVVLFAGLPIVYFTGRYVTIPSI